MAKGIYMVKLMLAIFFSVVVSSVTMANAAVSMQPDKLPKEVLFYAATFDKACMLSTDYKIKPQWVLALKGQLPGWQALWDKDGMLLLATTAKLTGKPFAKQDVQVALSLCTFPSMSSPLIVNARYALKAFTDHPISADVLISIIYHEMLHNYLYAYLPKTTPLLEKYKNEPQDVLDHLHLFALQKAVYLQLGWGDKLKAVIKKDESLPNKDNQIAWDIVNKKENYESFIAELK